LYAEAPTALVYAAAAIASISITFTRPAQNSLLPALTKTPSDLTAANVVSGMVEGVGKMLGPIIAGVALAMSGPGAVFAIFAVVTLLGAVLVARLPVDVGTVTPDARIDAADVWHETLRGFHTLRRAPEPRLVVMLLSSGVIVVGALDVLFVSTAIQLLDIGASGAGFLSAAFGAGAILGAASTILLVGRRRLSPSLAGGAVLFGAPIGLVAVAPSAVSAPILFAAAGAGRSVGDVSGRTLLQRVTPNDVLSRVFGVLEGMTMLALVIGSVGAAALIETWGVQTALVVVGAFLPLVILLSSGRLLSIDRSARAPDDEILRLLRAIPFFAPLPAPAMERVSKDVFALEVAAGDLLIREGDRGDLFYVIVEGRVEITRAGKLVSEQGPGGYVGEIALLRDVPRTASVIAKTPLRLLALEREPFLLAVTGHPGSHEAAHAVTSTRMA
jgi:MFS family permease